VAGAAPVGAGGLSLVSQSWSVTPGQRFALEVALPAGSPAAADLTVDATLYARLTTRSDLEGTFGGQPVGAVLDRTGALPVTGPPGRAVLSVAVTSGGAPAASPSLDLGCAPGSCSGVYPVAVTVSHRDGGQLGRLLTYLTYDESATNRLRFAWVVPFGWPAVIRTGARHPVGAVAPAGRAAVTALGQLAGALQAHPEVPVTVEASGQTVQALRRAGRPGLAVVQDLAQVSAQPHRLFPASSYVPVDAGALAGAGLSGELTLQVDRGFGLLHDAGLAVAPASATDPGTWVVNGPVGTDLAQGMATVHADRVVVPENSLAPGPQTAATVAHPFTLTLGRGQQLTALQSDGGLSGRFGALPGDPVLAASQLLADLAFIHYEEPGVGPRGVVAVPPLGWRPDPAFVGALLDGLSNDPVVQGATLDQLFALPPATGEAGTRRPATGGPGPVLPAPVADAVAGARRRLDGFQSAAPGAGTVNGSLDDLLLVSESDERSHPGQLGGVAAVGHQLQGQLDLLSLASDRRLTVTARAAPLPITVLSAAPYNVTGVVTLSSDKFVFPDGASAPLHLDRATNTVRINARARASGDFPVEVTLTSPDGHLVLTQGQLTVRSTATSVVGVVLTVVALVVLVFWWARTFRRSRRRHRAAG
jgi:hypothetical protein